MSILFDKLGKGSKRLKELQDTEKENEIDEREDLEVGQEYFLFAFELWDMR